MQQGICIDVGLSAILQQGRTYFLKSHGKRNFYVSNFNNPKSYFGSFRKGQFKLVEKPEEKPKRFVARVSSLRGWYAIGDEYIITEKDHTGYFHVYSKKRPHGCPLGSYLDNFFEIIEPFDEKGMKNPKKRLDQMF